VSDDKLQKSESAIEVSGNIGEAITRALPQDETPAQTGKSAVTRWPGLLDVCKCGHMYSQHNYSDSLATDRDDPLGYMYECQGEGREPAIPRDKWLCACEKFEFSAENTPSPKMAPVGWTRCIANPDDSIGPHDCPGGMVGSDGKMYFCKCSCAVCLKAERRAQGLNDSITPVFTDDRTCVAFGELGGDHTGCPVVVTSGSRIPTVCMCDCKDCKRKWFSDGRPVVRQGKIVRATSETANRVMSNSAVQQRARVEASIAARDEAKARVLGDDRPEDMLLPPEPRVDLLEVAKSLRKCTHPMHAVKTTKYGDEPCGKCYLITADNFCNPDCRCCRGLPSIDPVGLSIAFDVEPLNPVLRAEGSRPAGPAFEKLTPEQSSRLFRTGVPAGEYKATVASAQCKKCWGVGSVSVPGELVDDVCNACGGTGNEERIGPDGRRT
jgi:hypothetical protein